MKLAIIAEYDKNFEPHVQTDAAIGHSAAALDLEVAFEWLSTSDPRVEHLEEFDALWFAPGSPYRDMQRTLAAIQYARTNHIPTLGTCGGFQHMVIEVARNILGIAGAQHEEYDPYASKLIVSKLACSLKGREMQITLTPGSITSNAYGLTSVTERYYCDFGINPKFLDQLSQAGFVVVGTDEDRNCRVMEIPQHPFFVGTLFVPQAKSTAQCAHPLINEFFLAATR